jgi:hypothetical protein
MGMFAETVIVDCRLSFANQGKKTSVCSKQMEVCRFRFLFAENKGKLIISAISILRLRKHGDMEMDTWKHGDIDTETWKHGNMETRRHQTENGRSSSFVCF